MDTNEGMEQREDKDPEAKYKQMFKKNKTINLLPLPVW